MAISGLHVGLVSFSVAAVVGLLTRPMALIDRPWLPRWAALCAATIAAGAYGASVGWPASAQRAGWVVAGALLARAIGRPAPSWNLLGMAAAAVVLSDPGQVGELGFQLSFGAVIGILLWAPKVLSLAKKTAPWPVRWLLGAIGTTLGASIGTLPILAWDFQHLAPVCILANLIATPLLGTIAVPAALLAKLAPDGIAQMGLRVGDGAVGLALQLLTPLAIDPWTPAVGVWGATGLMLAATLSRKPVWAAVLILTCLAPTPRQPELTVTFPSIGQGNAALIEWPDGRRWLIDGGPASKRLLYWLRRKGIRKLDKVILSHPHPDHMGGLLPVAAQLDIKEMWAPDRPRRTHGQFFQLWRTAAQRGTSLKLAGADGLELLHPPVEYTPTSNRPINDRSQVLRIRYGRHSFLFTGDIEQEAEEMLMGRLPPTTVVQVPHHGSRTSSSDGLVDATRPRWAVVSAGKNNRFGHPAPIVLARWGIANVLRTDRDGSVRFRTDGQQITPEKWSNTLGWKKIERHPIRPSSTDH